MLNVQIFWVNTANIVYLELYTSEWDSHILYLHHCHNTGSNYQKTMNHALLALDNAAEKSIGDVQEEQQA